jgi:hypothetical protein
VYPYIITGFNGRKRCKQEVSMSEEHLCRWNRQKIEKNTKKLIKIVGKPVFLCKKCGRVAVKKKWLCKPEKIKFPSPR